jgi:hypothetical protein
MFASLSIEEPTTKFGHEAWNFPIYRISDNLS